MCRRGRTSSPAARAAPRPRSPAGRPRGLAGHPSGPRSSGAGSRARTARAPRPPPGCDEQPDPAALEPRPDEAAGVHDVVVGVRRAAHHDDLLDRGGREHVGHGQPPGQLVHAPEVHEPARRAGGRGGHRRPRPLQRVQVGAVPDPVGQAGRRGRHGRVGREPGDERRPGHGPPPRAPRARPPPARRRCTRRPSAPARSGSRAWRRRLLARRAAQPPPDHLAHQVREVVGVLVVTRRGVDPEDHQRTPPSTGQTGQTGRTKIGFV